MIRSATNQLDIPGIASARPVTATRFRRHISPQAGHALEILGHGIEYLSDEFMYEYPQPPFERKARMEAIELLMAMNRRVYLECPEIPSLRDRFVGFIQRLM